MDTKAMIQRVAYGVLAILILVLLIGTDAWVARRFVARPGAVASLLRCGSALPLACLLFVLAGATEFHRLMCAVGIRPHAIFARLMIIALMLTPWLAGAGWLGSGEAGGTLRWQVIWLAVTLAGLAVLTVLRRDPSKSLVNSGSTLLMILYLGFLGSFALSLRSAASMTGPKGAWLLLGVLLVIKASDIGAYFVGTALGRHRLIPEISPAKSVEGFVGGLFGSALIAVVLWAGFSRSILASSNGDMESAVSLGRAVVFGVSISLSGQVGDLVESCFKRDAGLKDSGRIMPRFGGILDVIDSPLLAVPVAWFLLVVVWRLV